MFVHEDKEDACGASSVLHVQCRTACVMFSGVQDLVRVWSCLECSIKTPLRVEILRSSVNCLHQKWPSAPRAVSQQMQADKSHPSFQSGQFVLIRTIVCICGHSCVALVREAPNHVRLSACCTRWVGLATT